MVRKIEACGVEKDTMINNLIIRKETEEDYKKTELMIMRSFWNKYWPGCTEHLLTRIIRDSQDYIPEISRIAEIDDHFDDEKMEFLFPNMKAPEKD